MIDNYREEREASFCCRSLTWASASASWRLSSSSESGWGALLVSAFLKSSSWRARASILLNCQVQRVLYKKGRWSYLQTQRGRSCESESTEESKEGCHTQDREQKTTKVTGGNVPVIVRAVAFSVIGGCQSCQLVSVDRVASEEKLDFFCGRKGIMRMSSMVHCSVEDRTNLRSRLVLDATKH